jgi:hypothetical protein
MAIELDLIDMQQKSGFKLTPRARCHLHRSYGFELAGNQWLRSSGGVRSWALLR